MKTLMILTLAMFLSFNVCYANQAQEVETTEWGNFAKDEPTTKTTLLDVVLVVAGFLIITQK